MVTNLKWPKIIHIWLTLQPPNYEIGIFTNLKLYLTDAMHNLKGVEIIQIWQNGGQRKWDQDMLIYVTFKSWYLICINEKPWENKYNRSQRIKG